MNTVQGIIQRKSVSGSRTLPFVIFDRKRPFWQRQCYFNAFLCYFKAFLGKTSQQVPFFEDSERCPGILNLLCCFSSFSVSNSKNVENVMWQSWKNGIVGRKSCSKTNKKIEYIDKLSFSSYETAKIEIQENSSDLGSFSCNLD